MRRCKFLRWNRGEDDKLLIRFVPWTKCVDRDVMGMSNHVAEYRSAGEVTWIVAEQQRIAQVRPV